MDEEEEYHDYNENMWTYISLCAEPTLYEGLRFAKDLIIANLLLRFIIQCVSLPHNVRHSLSLVIGGFLLYFSIGPAFAWIITLTTGSYVLTVLLSHITKKWRGFLMCITVIGFLLSCELYIINPKMWQQIRGVQMIAAMKIISIAIELDRGLFKQMLNPVEFGGYVLCPANCVLGPWISFHTYNQYLDVKFLSKRWIKIIIVNLFISMIFLVLSNCIVPWYIDDEMTKWLVAYRDAQAFRMSHYFVSSMSIVSMISAGFGLTNDCHSELQVTKPFFIELPRSLVQVVIYWNIPMHQWLKNYVFKTCQPFGQFTAIFVTYAVSSLLHGLNFQFSAVLLSIGTFSYVEYNLRCKVASALEVCCLANLCVKQCDHKHKKNSFLAVFVNALFSLITVMHLAYLGVMFEASFSVQESGYSYFHTISKWENLNFFSHGFAAFMYVIYLMM
ncbi:protein-serine O-palmitoleoyltransferase porcupine [Pectinophora gossypiella]|uniref:protein-serine O-palmitoleoyltransferase porcupine n=1 Tax=Pectinophora gossypiella TaxID=13191 RepID=UPI00214F0583|nr:protein-serine O-palmitoleoyltransferase porcupine [Pectinophora gossypiella]